MTGGNYQIAYIVINVFRLYVIHKFMCIFFGQKTRMTTYVTFGMYILYYLLISGIFFLVKIPIVVIAVNLIALFVLTFVYEADMKKRCLSAVFIYSIIMLAEILVTLSTGYWKLNLYERSEYSSISGRIVNEMVLFIIVLLLERFKYIKNGLPALKSLCLSFIFVPASSLWLILMILQNSGFDKNRIILSVVLLLLTNITMFYLLDAVKKQDRLESEREWLIRENQNLRRMSEVIQETQNRLRKIEHDGKNHLGLVKSFISAGEYEKAVTHLDSVLSLDNVQKNYVDTGNAVLDNILNFKMQEAAGSGITIEHSIIVPDTLDVDSFDMTVILGNILDNAMEAVRQGQDRNFPVSLTIKYDKGRLFIKEENRIYGEVQYGEDGSLITSKKMKEHHGIGLKNVKEIVQKYDGEFETEITNNIFTIFIMLYLKL